MEAVPPEKACEMVVQDLVPLRFSHWVLLGIQCLLWFKNWCLCDSRTGYFSAFDVYRGKNWDDEGANLDQGF